MHLLKLDVKNAAIHLLFTNCLFLFFRLSQQVVDANINHNAREGRSSAEVGYLLHDTISCCLSHGTCGILTGLLF